MEVLGPQNLELISLILAYTEETPGVPLILEQIQERSCRLCVALREL